MEIILANAKLASWLRSFSEIEPTKRRTSKVFQWMEIDIIPFWMFSDIVESIKNVEDNEYFDEYNVDHHSGYDSYKRMNNTVGIIFIFLNLYACLYIGLVPLFHFQNLIPFHEDSGI